MASQECKVDFLTLIREFPVLEEWFREPLNTTAQVKDNKRFMSAGERLTKLGGKENIKTSLSRTPRSDKLSFLILQACRQEPSVITEAIVFMKLIEYKTGIGATFLTANRLLKQGELIKVPEISYVQRLSSETFQISTYLGTLTTNNGLRKIAENIQPSINSGLRKLLPQFNS